MDDRVIESRYYVYAYKYPNGTPFYIGKGTKKRMYAHLWDAKAERNLNSFNIRIIRKILKNNEQPIIEKIVDNVDQEFAVLVEKEAIAKYGRRDLGTGILVNMTSGGDGAIDLSDATKKRMYKPMSEEFKKKMSVRMKGINNPFYGKKHTAESIEKMRLASLGVSRPHSKETKKKLSKLRIGKLNPFYGKHHSEETKKKVSESIKKRPNISYWKGKTFSEEHLAKLRIERTCPHCGIIGRGSAMNRYHFNNCKKVKV